MSGKILQPSSYSSKNLPNHSKQAQITLEQSLDVIKTNVYGVLSEITRQRRCIDSRAFRLTNYTRNDKLLTYEDIIQSPALDEDAKVGKSKAARDLSLQFLRHHSKCEGGNTLIKWIEAGVFQALEDGCLRAAQLRILEYEQPFRALETYTLAFQHITKSSQYWSADDSDSAYPTTVIDVTKRFSIVMAELSSFLLQRPSLPKYKNIELVLSLTEDAPNNYALPGFTELRSSTFYHAMSKSWQLRPEQRSQVTTPFDRVFIWAMYLAYTGFDHIQEPSTIPNKLPLTRKYRLDENLKSRLVSENDEEVEDDIEEQREQVEQGSTTDEAATPTLDDIIGHSQFTGQRVNPDDSAVISSQEEQTDQVLAMLANFGKPTVTSSQATLSLDPQRIPATQSQSSRPKDVGHQTLEKCLPTSTREKKAEKTPRGVKRNRPIVDDSPPSANTRNRRFRCTSAYIGKGSSPASSED